MNFAKDKLTTKNVVKTPYKNGVLTDNFKLKLRRPIATFTYKMPKSFDIVLTTIPSVLPNHNA